MAAVAAAGEDWKDARDYYLVAKEQWHSVHTYMYRKMACGAQGQGGGERCGMRGDA
jgi:hypothetical protein